jgi:hypothetical protein
MPRAGYGDLEVGTETSAPQAVHPAGNASAPGLTFVDDADSGLYIAGANEIGMSAGGTGQVIFADGIFQPVTTNDVDLGAASYQFKDAYIDGTLEADAITVGGTAIADLIAATTITNVNASANNSTDETVYPVFVDGATGAQGIETDTGLTYNPSSGVLTTTQVTGALSGNATSATTATTATNITVSANNSTDETVYPIFVDGATGGQGAESDTGLTYNPSSGIITATQFTGAVSGNATTATEATNVTVSANNSTDETVYPVFVDGATGTQGVESDTGLTYNPSTGALTATSFTGAVTGAVTGAASEVTASANNSTDETVYPTFVDGATGSQGIETDTGLTYNPSTGVLTSTTFTGALSGNATTATEATNITASANNSTDETVYPVFIDGATGTQGIETDTGLTYNPSTGVLTATSFSGSFSGTSTSATDATNVTVSANNSTDETVYPVFVDGATGSQGIESDTGLTYNPSTGVLTSTTFTGALSGNATSSTTATTATNVTASANNSSDETVYPTFVDGATGGQGIETDTGLTYNPSTGVITATQFTGAVSGNATTSTTATTATNVTVSANNTTDETVYPLFVDGATGGQGAETDTGLTYNPSTGALTATSFVGVAGKSVGFIIAMA